LAQVSFDFYKLKEHRAAGFDMRLADMVIVSPRSVKPLAGNRRAFSLSGSLSSREKGVRRL
jgi:hypothetical protein